jgi:UDP-N-acetylmuramyl pentapeptide phosphotransferase/UDP-N-acetylglucosamine-1-phosphate transferase
LSSFLLTKRELYKLTFMLLIATAAFGISGLVIILMMQWMTLQSYAAESTDKHGISEVKASRLGGVAVAVGVMVAMAFLLFNGHRGGNSNAPLGMYWSIWLGIFGCFFLGLLEDLRNGSLSPRARLVSKSLLLLVVFLLSPYFVPDSVGIPGVDWLLGFSWLALIITLFFSVGFINAVNTVDGANGLLSGIFAITCFIFASEVGGVALQSALYGASLFLIFNVISGRLFLGDAGSYGIGAGMLMCGLGGLNLDLVSPSFLAALYFYPCVDFVVSICRRLLSGESITAPDNDHLHNRVHTFYKRRFRSKNMANSATGLSIAGMSSGLVLILYLFDTIPLDSHQWIFVFIAQGAIYAMVFVATGARNRMYSRLDEM